MEHLDTATVFEELRPLLFSIAYRMLGSVADAEDVVQDAYVRFQHAVDSGTEIDSPKAYLTATITRLAIDELRSARVRRERYFGTWLPEPLVTDTTADVAQHAETADSLSMAFLVVLESLSPVERAVFLLRDVFDYQYRDIAQIVGKSEANVRQLAVRARRYVDERRPRFEASRREREELARRFLAAVEDGDTDALVEMLAADVALYGDGGGKAPAIPRPVFGRDRVVRMLVSWMADVTQAGVSFELAEINGQPGARSRAPDGSVFNVVTLDIADGVVQAIRAIINPEKLQHLGSVSDARRVLGRRPVEDRLHPPDTRRAG
jgi:RNA polymerase sigma-70 factor (ECF subfamily)